MSIAIDISERRLKLGIVKLAIMLVGVFALLALGLSALAGQGQGLALGILVVTVSFSFLTNGVLAVLKIIDWFEARNRRHG
ncbi:MAG: hypothetical protein V4574_12710 [Pseudomonadota bacterium]